MLLTFGHPWLYQSTSVQQCSKVLNELLKAFEQGLTAKQVSSTTFNTHYWLVSPFLFCFADHTALRHTLIKTLLVMVVARHFLNPTLLNTLCCPVLSLRMLIKSDFLKNPMWNIVDMKHPTTVVFWILFPFIFIDKRSRKYLQQSTQTTNWLACFYFVFSLTSPGRANMYKCVWKK